MSAVNDTLTALETARSRVIAQTEQARTAARDAHRLSEDLRSVARTVTSVGGDVSVRASAGGSVENVEITPRALDLDPRTLSRLVTETVRTAQREAAEAALERMAQTVGSDSPLVASTRATLEAQFGRSTEIL